MTFTLLTLVGTAAATPSVSFVPEFSSGLLGGPGSVNATVKIAGTEYGGFPPPTVGIALRLPVGTTLTAGGHATCAKEVLEQVGPLGCPESSAAGPIGTATGIVSFGEERIQETALLETFFSPEGGLYLFIDGHSPISLEVLGRATVAGNEITVELPLVSTVPGAPYASLTELWIRLGESEEEESVHKIQSGITLPSECPSGLFSWSAGVTFDNEGANPPKPEATERSYETNCLARQEPLRKKRIEEARGRKQAQEEAATKRKAEEEAAVRKRQLEEAELIALRAHVKTLQEELHARVKIKKVKVRGHAVVVTITVSEAGRVTMTGAGLKRVVTTLSAGTRQISLVMTEHGQRERRQHHLITLSLSERVNSRIVKASEKVRL
jgi:hypothetical protein